MLIIYIVEDFDAAQEPPPDSTSGARPVATGMLLVAEAFMQPVHRNLKILGLTRGEISLKLS